jgi:DNA-binding protein H-NS
MRANVRPFVREYKSRSRETAMHPLNNWVANNEGAQTPNRQRDERTIQLDRVQKEAEVVFRRKEILSPPLATANEGQGGSQFTGRVLPCLLQEPVAVVLQSDEAADRARRRQSSHVAKSGLASRSKPSPDLHTPSTANGAQTTVWSRSVSDEFAKLSDLEILSLIERAKAELDRRKEDKKEQLRAEIEAKLKSAGLDLGDLFENERRGTRGKSKEDDGQKAVAAKYKNHVTGETWSGRGRSPKWVVAILQERDWTVEEFKQSEEFLIA